MKSIKDQCAERKAARLAGKTRGRPRMRPVKTPEQLAAEYRNPLLRYKPARDGTRRGIPNGMPDRYLRPESVDQRNRAMKARAGTLQPYASIFKL